MVHLAQVHLNLAILRANAKTATPDLNVSISMTNVLRRALKLTNAGTMDSAPTQASEKMPSTARVLLRGSRTLNLSSWNLTR